MFLVFILQLFCQVSTPSRIVDSGIDQWKETSGGNPEIMARKGQELFHAGEVEGDCEKHLIGYGLLLEAHNKSPEAEITVPVLDTTTCPVDGLRIPRAEAIRLFDQAMYAEARPWFKIALERAEEPKLLASLKQSIGMTYYMAYELDSAMVWFVESTAYGVELLTSVSLSNLANVSYIQGNFEESLKWGKLAEERLLKEFQTGIDAKEFQMRLDLVLINQVLSAMEIGDLPKAQANYGRMTLQDAFPGLAQEYFHAALQLAWALNDPYPIEIHEDMYAEHLIRDSVAMVQRFGAALCLIEPWRTQWALEEPEGANVWQALRALPLEQLPDVTLHPRQAANASGIQTDKSLVALWMLTLLSYGGLAWWWWRFRRRTDNGDLSDNSDPTLLLRLAREAVFQPSEENREAGKQAVLALSQSIPQYRLTSFPSNLSAREIDILYAAAIQERPKTTAQRLGLSSKSIYMIRTDVSKKLGLTTGQKIEDWLSEVKEPKP